MGAVYYVGDAISVMGKLPAKSVDLVLTSPPFLALRSYLPTDHPDKALEGGSQATPGAYIDWLVDVVEACARILAPHGSLCFELGDTYAGSGGAGGDYNPDGLREGQPKFKQTSGWHRGTREGREEGAAYRKEGTVDTSLQNGGTGWPLAKSLSLIPELFRTTLVYGTNPLTGRTTERWRLRNVIRWVRPNPPVGALGDKFRPATSELMVFCKSAKRFFDLDAVREPHKSDPSKFTGNGYEKGRPEGLGVGTIREPGNPAGAPPLDWWNIPPGGYEGAHYAVWPPELCVKPIKAMSPEKVCRVCGEPSRRIVDAQQATELPDGTLELRRGQSWAARSGANNDARPSYDQGHVRITQTLGWTHCMCNVGSTDQCLPDRWTEQVVHEPGECRDPRHYRPGLVLDPFAGSGTTLAVATGHGRDAIGIDLDERNYELALQRVGPFLLELAEM